MEVWGMALVDGAFASYLDELIPARAPVLQEMEAYARTHRFPIVWGSSSTS